MADWYLKLDGKEIGPISTAEFKELIRTSVVKPDTQVRTSFSKPWSTAERIKGIQFPGSSRTNDVLMPPPISSAIHPIDATAATVNKTDGVTTKTKKKRSFLEPIDPEFWNDGPTSKSSQSSTQTIGQLLVGIGTALLIGFTLYDTSVDSGGFGRVHNIGLQQNRLLGFVAGLATILIGAVMFIISKMSVNADRRNGVLNSSVKSDQPIIPNSEFEKDCPFCAEKIKANAKKCKHCGEYLQ